MYYGKITLAALCLCTTLLPLDARADNTPGSLVTISNGGTNARNLFTISGNTITINGDESGNSRWSLSGAVSGRLLGISKLFLVDVKNSTHTPTPGPNVSTILGAGYVKTNAAALFSSRTNWTHDTSKSYSRFVDTGNGGFSANDPWLTVGDPKRAGKGGTAKNEFGSFTFDVTSLLDARGKLKYDLGIDYLIQSGSTGTTGRAYFAPTFDSSRSPVPEFSTMFGFGGLVTLGGLVAFRQSRQAHKAS